MPIMPQDLVHKVETTISGPLARIGLAVIAGVCPVRIDVQEESDTFAEVQDEDDISFTAVVATEDGQKIGGSGDKRERYRIYKGHFDDHVAPDPERERRDHWKKKTLIEAVWGWAITCHKAQGSQWENVIVWDDGLGQGEADRRRWLYTAITRAERGLVILA